MIKEKGYQWTPGITSNSYLTKEEMAGRCGLQRDTSMLQEMLQVEDSLYQQYKAAGMKSGKLFNTLSVPNWIGMMDSVWNQECENCWAYAAAAVTVGLLHNYYGSNVGIHLDQMDITNNASCGNCGGTSWLPCGLSYIYSSKVRSKQGLNQFPNFDHGYYTVSSYSVNSVSISAIKSALQTSPVLAGMEVYEDFAYYYTGGVYQHTFGNDLGGHAVVIVSYDDANSCWICKNSWGGNWGEREPGQIDKAGVNGYFRIAYGQCGIDAEGNVTASVTSSGCLAKMISNFQSLQNAVNFSFVSNELAYVLTSQTVNAGQTLTVPSGAKIVFQAGTYLAVNGTLNASSATFDQSGSSSWMGITYNSGSSGSLNNCTIQHAGTGVTCNGGLSSISSCTIRYNGIGIRCNNVMPPITNCHIDYNSGMGIWLSNVGTPSAHIAGNSFYNYSQQGQAMALYYSSPQIDNSGPNNLTNYIFYNNMGIFCVGSAPQISNSEIDNCVNGLYVIANSHPTIGPYDRMIGNRTAIYADGSYNVYSYYTDVYPWNPGYMAVVATNSAQVIAQADYWGQYPPNPSNFSATNGALIFYQPGSPSPWTGPLSSTAPSVNPDPRSSQSRSSNPKTTASTSDGGYSFDQEVLDAEKMIGDGKYEDAIKFYTTKLKSTDNVAMKRYVLGQLAECYRGEGKKDFSDFLNTEVRPQLSKDDGLYATTLELENLFLIPGHDYKKAIENLTTLKTQFASDATTSKNALFDLGYIHNFLLNDAVKGKGYFDELKSKYPDDMLTWQARLFLGEVDSIPASSGVKSKGSVAEGVLGDVALIDNYPNPFNPTTVISYTIPKDGQVTLKIFDVLGREVKTLVNEFQQVGRYSVTLDGSGLASGVYFYRLVSGNYVSTKKMMLMK
ncbi:MAG TPA: C1 family peptidase [Candidatus Acidoferrales bacterium]|nr:C1 family peptidase [Candidatus Acidoferrales bacterium]